MDLFYLKEYLDKIVNENVSPSVDCIVKKDREIIFRYFSGYADIESKKLIDGNEQYLIFSMTKLFTCVCALQLLEQNKYSLDDPIEMYLPEFSNMTVKITENGNSNQKDILTGKSFGETINESDSGFKKASRSVTVRDLFSMSAGFNYDINSAAIKDAVKCGCNTTRTIVSSLSKTPLEFEPGTHFRYSLCHDVLGALIEIWSGKTFSEYLHENICVPLTLKSTYFSKHDNSNNKNLASLYVKDNQNFVKRELINHYTIVDGYESGGAGLISTVNDYSIFIDALANDGIADNGYKLLNKQTIDLMRTNQLKDKQYADFQQLRAGYGYGLGVRTHTFPDISGSLSPIGEFGWDGAAGAFSMVDPINRISLVYFQHCLSWDKSTQHVIRNFLYKSLGDMI